MFSKENQAALGLSLVAWVLLFITYLLIQVESKEEWNALCFGSL